MESLRLHRIAAKMSASRPGMLGRLSAQWGIHDLPGIYLEKRNLNPLVVRHAYRPPRWMVLVHDDLVGSSSLLGEINLDHIDQDLVDIFDEQMIAGYQVWRGLLGQCFHTRREALQAVSSLYQLMGYQRGVRCN